MSRLLVVHFNRADACLRCDELEDGAERGSTPRESPGLALNSARRRRQRPAEQLRHNAYRSWSAGQRPAEQPRHIAPLRVAAMRGSKPVHKLDAQQFVQLLPGA